MKGTWRVRKVKQKFYRAINKLAIKKKYYCNICQTKTYRRMAKGRKGEIFNKLQIIGGGYRPKAFCINCYSYDRERYVFYIIKKYTDILTEKKKVLHIAPEESIRKEIENNYKNCEYYTGDLKNKDYTYCVDITNMQFEDESFDYFICNHVLEHIIEEKQAINEIKRILKKGGKAIISVPISMANEKTMEYDGTKDEKSRLEKYGQEDHVRLYGKDFKKRLESYGLNVTEYVVKNELSTADIKKLSLIPEDRIYICKKVI